MPIVLMFEVRVTGCRHLIESRVGSLEDLWNEKAKQVPRVRRAWVRIGVGKKKMIFFQNTGLFRLEEYCFMSYTTFVLKTKLIMILLKVLSWKHFRQFNLHNFYGPSSLLRSNAGGRRDHAERGRCRFQATTVWSSSFHGFWVSK